MKDAKVLLDSIAGTNLLCSTPTNPGRALNEVFWEVWEFLKYKLPKNTEMYVISTSLLGCCLLFPFLCSCDIPFKVSLEKY